MFSKKQKNPQPKDDKKQFRAPRGMHDVLPADQIFWERVEFASRNVARMLNFSRIETPVLEFAELFTRTNEDADIVQKEMYTLKTKGGDFLALRPEYTAPKMRAYMEHSLSRLGQPQRLWNFGPVFRHERPQFGRHRQFFQVDFDIIGGTNDPIYDAEIIFAIVTLLEELKLRDLILEINSVGCRVCRPLYKKQLQNFYKNHKKNLCFDCERRLNENPIRLLDCKNEPCVNARKNVPNILDKICAMCSSHFKCVLEYLDELGIAYALNNFLVRGLDYYSRTVFEIFTAGKEKGVGALASGGRYDYLMEMIGGHLTPAVGGALGVDRAIYVIREREIKPAPRQIKKVFLACVGESAKKKIIGLVKSLVSAGIPISEAFSRDSLKAQLRFADKEDVPLALILGQKEVYEKTVMLRDMRTGLQDNIRIDKIVEEVKKRLKA